MVELRSLGMGHLVIPVSDIKRSLKFYRDVLGLEIRWEMSEMGLIGLGCGSWEIILSQYPFAKEFERISVYRPSLHFGFMVQERQDVDKWASKLASQRVQLLESPADNEFGRLLVLQDPNGHEIEILWNK